MSLLVLLAAAPNFEAFKARVADERAHHADWPQIGAVRSSLSWLKPGSYIVPNQPNLKLKPNAGDLVKWVMERPEPGGLSLAEDVASEWTASHPSTAEEFPRGLEPAAIADFQKAEQQAWVEAAMLGLVMSHHALAPEAIWFAIGWKDATPRLREIGFSNLGQTRQAGAVDILVACVEKPPRPEDPARCLGALGELHRVDGTKALIRFAQPKARPELRRAAIVGLGNVLRSLPPSDAGAEEREASQLALDTLLSRVLEPNLGDDEPPLLEVLKLRSKPELEARLAPERTKPHAKPVLERIERVIAAGFVPTSQALGGKHF